MFLDIVFTLLSLGVILLFCFIFTNAIEWLGKLLNIGQGVVGSVFAAIGTALPETIIPIIAIVFMSGQKSVDIGIGAIAGAPFMLSTLAFFVTGISVIIFAATGKRSVKMNVDQSVVTRDLSFFIVIYGIAILTSFISTHIAVKCTIAVILLLSYIIYIRSTFKDDGEQCSDVDDLYLAKLIKKEAGLGTVIAQLVFSLIGIIATADFFVTYIGKLSTTLGVAPLILSIIITPIATELPEKLNSVIWTKKGKDTLALGNITGAMVFQSCFPIVFGMLLTPWKLSGVTLVSAILALSSALINLIWVKITKKVNAYVLLIGGVLYILFMLYVFA